ncbi:hypothetical protein BS50DRAFT_347821 [Corynespora cassiicola Philippines]|uniref:VWFA domain-containing protein n=1 Tax=Corynespora cassiicola Philippines TaxID=1448308 RepID=A0A2T2NQQ6_CORCC|nr:hypothetical protein BS50DRAFT_347821 [Corynespora cassiicola Philippines]
MRTLIYHLAAYCSLAILSFPLPSTSAPFGTIDFAAWPFYQHREHEFITRFALQCPNGQKSDGICFESESIDNLAGKSGKNGAIGAPDDYPGTEPAQAHCDNADFLDVPGYPQQRWQADSQLQICVNHLRRRFRQGVQATRRLLDKDDRIVTREAEIKSYCDFNHRDTLDDDPSARAKCVALEGLGRALHGIEDFYSHSNWADQADQGRPVSAVNPPGLGNTGPAPFLSLRASNNISLQIPRALTTGCFDDGEFPSGPDVGTGACLNRVLHLNLNKDHGRIDPRTGAAVADPPSRREAVAGNFQRAVAAAVADAKEQWQQFRDALRSEHGAEKGNLMVCALVRDDPIKDCRNRKIAIVVDSSGSNLDTDPRDLRIQAAVNLNSKLLTKAQITDEQLPDRVAVVDFDTSATILYPMGDPDGAKSTFTGIDSSGGTSIGSGIAAGIDEIMKDEPGSFTNRSGIVVLTDGMDQSPSYQLTQLARAKSNGIRISAGFLSPVDVPIPPKRSLSKRAIDSAIISAILQTGGTFGVISSDTAQQNFISLIAARGITDIDAPVGSTVLFSGVTVNELVGPNKPTHRFLYSTSASENISFTLNYVTYSDQSIRAVLRDVHENIDVGTVNATYGLPSRISFSAAANTDLELVVSMVGNQNASLEVIFGVGLNTNMPEKPETTTTMSTTSTNFYVTSTTIANATLTTSSNITLTTTPFISTTGGYGSITATSITSSGWYTNSTTTQSSSSSDPVYPSPTDSNSSRSVYPTFVAPSSSNGGYATYVTSKM